MCTPAHARVDGKKVIWTKALDSSGSPIDSSNPQDVTVVAGTTIYNGQTTIGVAGSAAVVKSTTTIKSITVKALVTNTGIVYVGDSSVDNTNGYELEAGESISLDVSDTASVYVDVSVNGEGVSYIAIN